MSKFSKIVLFSLLYLVSSIGLSLAQDGSEFCNEIESKKAVKNFNKAVNLLMNGDYDKATDILVEVLEIEEEFTEAWVALSDIYYKKYQNANNSKERNNHYEYYIVCLKKIVDYCPGYSQYSITYELGKIYFDRSDYKTSKNYLKKFLDNADKNSKYYHDAKNTLTYIDKYNDLLNNPVPFNPVVVEGISTAKDDYLPLISPDGSLAYYTQAYLKNDKTTMGRTIQVEEFVFSDKISDSSLLNVSFSDGNIMPNPFNGGVDQGAVSISIDNSTMYITLCEFVSRTYKNCDIYETHRTIDGWSKLNNLGPNINGKDTWESQPSVTADGKSLYFASIRPENIGFKEGNYSSDIYVSEKNEYGVWSKAKNVGQVINTKGDEKSPFMHSDSKTLYFSSTGHLGIGGLDIFFSKYRDGNWTEPRNIGYPINTKRDDVGFIVSTNGKKAYFSSNNLRNSMGGYDIYSMDLYEEARPEKVLFVKGSIQNDFGSNVEDAKIEVRNVRTQEVTAGVVDTISGNYALALSIDEETKDDDYLMLVKSKGNSFTSKLIEPNEEILSATNNVDFEVKSIEVGKTVEIHDIYYKTASAEIDAKSLIVLDSFYDFLIENKNIIFEIYGHTDNTGNHKTNLVLSQKRAKSVYEYLLNKGITKARMSYKGFGQDKPVADNSTEAGRAKNRRTEFYITKH